MRPQRALLGVGLAGLVTALVALVGLPAYLGPVDLAAPRTVVVPPGQGAGQTAADLEAAGVVRSRRAMQILVWWAGAGRRLQAGEYRFAGHVEPREVVRRLVSGDVVLHEVTVPEGLTLIRTVALLEAAGLEIQGSLEQETRRVDRIAAFDPQATDLEGYLFPDTYTFSRRVTARAVVDRLVARFREVADSLQAELGPPDRTVRAWVALASLVERETGRDDERERVASVFLNRLDRNMLLQCDPTVLYALERAGEPHGESLADRLAFDDPYNTYLHAGLPPGPIASPGEAALRASLHPARHDELYFVADGDGGHRFSRTLREHNRAVRDLRRRTMAGPGR